MTSKRGVNGREDFGSDVTFDFRGESALVLWCERRAESIFYFTIIIEFLLNLYKARSYKLYS